VEHETGSDVTRTGRPPPPHSITPPSLDPNFSKPVFLTKCPSCTVNNSALKDTSHAVPAQAPVDFRDGERPGLTVIDAPTYRRRVIRPGRVITTAS